MSSTAKAANPDVKQGEDVATPQQPFATNHPLTEKEKKAAMKKMQDAAKKRQKEAAKKGITAQPAQPQPGQPQTQTPAPVQPPAAPTAPATPPQDK